ncbi:MAG: dephospho-CoA kinase [Lachnospiraceae bacterium]|nr:dephospho-CoA kinase [Lachnospiraceae bacterium]
MKIIGITGGVGAGKTQVLSYIAEHYRCRIIRADEAAHLLYEKGQECYKALVAFLGEQILSSDGTIDKKKMASLIFGDKALLEGVNAIVHPAVKRYIIEQIACERAKKEVDYFFIEAALLIEEHYDEIVDELWYIHSDEAVRRERLYQSRQYSEQKVSDIMKKQLSENAFRQHCQRVILNNSDLEETYQQIQRIMGDLGHE